MTKFILILYSKYKLLFMILHIATYNIIVYIIYLNWCFEPVLYKKIYHIRFPKFSRTVNDRYLFKGISYLFLFVQPPLRFSCSFQPMRIVNLMWRGARSFWKSFSSCMHCAPCLLWKITIDNCKYCFENSFRYSDQAVLN